ncbi:unnamed protein product [Nesidiocoris tenuis]|uniref:HTH CENPB-type domain-containing protein n=1 Tax=Nesidiocoris tenuis TaxID=355587 RepID=A0A6H5HND6_9HEMI|nr:unnamed protein product [Nesidiocoris tenuis]
MALAFLRSETSLAQSSGGARQLELLHTGHPAFEFEFQFTFFWPASLSPASILSSDEEEVLVQWICEMSKARFPVTSEQLKDSVQHLLKKELRRKSPFKDDRPGKKWLQCFMKRHPSIRERVAENLTVSRSSVTKEDIASWFQRTEKYLREKSMLNILESPQRVFNADETAFFLNPKGKRVLAPKGAKNVYLTVNNDEKGCVTVLLTANALGEIAPPMVVFKYERVPDIIAESVPDHWGMGKSENGWMTGATFFEYITKIFEPWLKENQIPRPVIFFMDGHTSHITYHLSDFCLKENIILIALPPNTTHFMQPMDVSVFRSLKEIWKTTVHNWRVEHVNVMLKKKDFCPLLDAVIRGISPAIVKSGFRKCGLVPWDMRATAVFSEDTLKPTGSNVPSNDTVQQSLLILERFIGEDTVKLFKESPRGTGRIEDSSLFMTWQRMRRCCLMDLPREEILDTSQGELINDVLADGLGSAAYPANDMLSNQRSSLAGEDAIELVPSEPLKDFDNFLISSTSEKTESNSPPISNQFMPQQLITEEAIVHNDQNTPVKSNYLTEHVVEAIVHTQPTSPVKPKTLLVPSPFKRALNWPEPCQKTKKSRNRESMPSVVSSVEYKNYLKTKLDKKAKEEEKKKERAAERARKKSEREKIKLEKAAEREKKKAMTQAKKKLAVKKKSKRVVQTSSSEDDHGNWVPQDESEEYTENEDYQELDQCNDDLMQLDHSLIYIPPDHENLMLENTSDNVLITVDELGSSDIHETQEETVISIE